MPTVLEEFYLPRCVQTSGCSEVGEQGGRAHLVIWDYASSQWSRSFSALDFSS